MPYDITDAKDDIQLLSAKIDAIIKVLGEKGLLPKEESQNGK